MSRLVDCRFCRWFRRELGDDELASAARQGVPEPLGWCDRYGRPVTYYVGRCGGFERREAPGRQARLWEVVS